MVKRFCGNCGEIIKKKKPVCQECDALFNEYKKPYNKMTPQMKKSIMFFIIVAIIWMSFNLFLWINDIPGARNMFIILVIILTGAGISAYQTKSYISSGFKKCMKCKGKSSLIANYCIHCGNKITWRYKPVK